MDQGIPGKGRILTQVANFWFERHRRTSSPTTWSPPRSESSLRALRALCRAAPRAGPSSCAGPRSCPSSAWCAATWPGPGLKEYQGRGTVCGIRLPSGPAQRRPPARADLHPLHQGGGRATTRTSTSSAWPAIVGRDLAVRLRDVSLALYRRGRASWPGARHHPRRHQVRVRPAGGRQLILIDEALTPDSSRYWLADTWRPGANPPSLDKQFLRDYLETLPGLEQAAPGAAPARPQVIEGDAGALPGPGAALRGPGQLTDFHRAQARLSSQSASWGEAPVIK